MPTTEQQVSLNTIFNKFFKAYPDLKLKNMRSDTTTWLRKYKEKVFDFIIDAYSNLNSRKTHLNNLGVVLKKEMKLKTMGQKYINQAVQFDKKNTQEKLDQDDDGMVDDKCFIPQQDILNKYAELKAKYDENPTDLKIMNKMLIVALNVYQPPLRRNIGDMIITNTLTGLDKKKNYLFVNGIHTRYIINKDKISRKVDSKTFKELYLTLIARTIVEKTLQNIPRTYLITNMNDKEKPMSTDSYSKQLNSIFSGHDCKVSQNTLRKSYVSNLWATNPTEKVKQETAKLMRTSKQMLDVVYNQRIKQQAFQPVKDTNNQKAIPKPIKIEPISKKELLAKLDEDKPTFDPKVYNKEYRKEHKVEIKKYYNDYYNENKENIIKNKILSRLNAGQVESPTKTSVNKYDLKYDSKNKIWI